MNAVDRLRLETRRRRIRRGRERRRLNAEAAPAPEPWGLPEWVTRYLALTAEDQATVSGLLRTAWHNPTADEATKLDVLTRAEAILFPEGGCDGRG